MDKGLLDETVVITFGTFDLFHVGHLRILQRAMEFGTTLHVGVSSDALNFKKKNRTPVVPCTDRMEIVRSISGVSSVFVEDDLEKKEMYCKQMGANVLVMGDDHRGSFDHLKTTGIRVIYIPRTEGVSTSQLLFKINKLKRSGSLTK